MRVGLVGGLGPESTIDYYRRLIGAWHVVERSTLPPVMIDSLDAGHLMRLITNDPAEVTEYLLASLHRLARAGVDFAAITANTPHLAFDELLPRTPIPLISIVEVCAAEVHRRGFTRVALLGTRFTMEGSFYPAVCAQHGVTIVTPCALERDWVHALYVGELLKGEFRSETRDAFVALVDRLKRDERIEGVILGGTELPLLLPGDDIAGVPVLDTTGLHVAAIVQRLRAGA